MPYTDDDDKAKEESNSRSEAEQNEANWRYLIFMVIVAITAVCLILTPLWDVLTK